MDIVDWMRQWSVQQLSELFITLVMFMLQQSLVLTMTVNKVPLLGVGVLPRCIEFIFLLKQGIGDKVMLSAFA